MTLNFEMNADSIPAEGRAIIEVDPTPQGYSIITKYLNSFGEIIRQDCHMLMLQGSAVGAVPGEVG
jgi:hypothetical protein